MKVAFGCQLQRPAKSNLRKLWFLTYHAMSPLHLHLRRFNCFFPADSRKSERRGNPRAAHRPPAGSSKQCAGGAGALFLIVFLESKLERSRFSTPICSQAMSTRHSTRHIWRSCVASKTLKNGVFAARGGRASQLQAGIAHARPKADGRRARRPLACTSYSQGIAHPVGRPADRQSLCAPFIPSCSPLCSSCPLC
jgi:hypothetical protein